MYNIFNKIFDKYHELWDSRDTRLNHMPLMSSPFPMVLLSLIYLFIVGMGKKWMEHRQPMQIDRIIIVYNVMQIVINSMFFLMATYHIFIENPNFSFECEPVNFSTGPVGMHVAYVGYSYLILKLIDYLDTVFFILRKKWAQVSFLHVYHHVSTSMVAYFILLYAPGGQSILFFYTNSFVHAVMYTYYLLSIYNPMKIKSSMTLKRNVTRLQIIQFYIMAVHFGHGFVIPGHDCGCPKIESILCFILNLLMIVLFTGFYRKAYGQEKKPQNIQLA